MDDAVAVVNRVADALEKTIDTILDAVGDALDAALRTLEAAFLAILDALQALANGIIAVFELLSKFGEKIARIRQVIQQIEQIIRDPGPALEKIRAYIEPMIGKAVASAESIGKRAITFSPTPPNHWNGIWRHLKPKLDYLASNWWEVLKTTAWHLIWPFAADSPLWKDLKDIWQSIKAFFGFAFSLEISKATDEGLRILQLAESIVGVFYGWVFIGMVAGYGIAGGIAGAEVGVLPGVIAGMGVGATQAAVLGEGLVAVSAATEGAILLKAGYNLVFQSQTPEENEKDYERIADSSLTLGILGALVLLSEIGGRFAKSLVSRAPRVLAAIGRAVLGPRAVEWIQEALARIRARVRVASDLLREQGKLKGFSSLTPGQYEGPARNLHPERFGQIIDDLESKGVKIDVNSSGDPWKGGYYPSSTPGEAGSMRVHQNVDLRTLEHEYQHFLDDQARGFPGLRYYIENPAEMWEMERVAYDREIEMVRNDGSLSAEDKEGIIRELEAAKEAERIRYLGGG